MTNTTKIKILHLIKKLLTNRRLMLAVAVPISVSLFWRTPWFLTAVIALISFGFLWCEGFKRKYVIAYAAIAAAGFVAESACVLAGAWTYTKPNMGVVPVWLPLIWGCAALVINQVLIRAKN